MHCVVATLLIDDVGGDHLVGRMQVCFKGCESVAAWQGHTCYRPFWLIAGVYMWCVCMYMTTYI